MTDAQALIERLKAERAERIAKAPNASSELWQRPPIRERKPQVPDDPWVGILAAVENMPPAAGGIERVAGEIRVASRYLLGNGALGFDRSQVSMRHILRLAKVMRGLGWKSKTFRMQEKTTKGYVKDVPEN